MTIGNRQRWRVRPGCSRRSLGVLEGPLGDDHDDQWQGDHEEAGGRPYSRVTLVFTTAEDPLFFGVDGDTDRGAPPGDGVSYLGFLMKMKIHWILRD